MQINNIKVYGLENSFRVSKFPMSVETSNCTEEYTDRIKKLGKAKRGSGHDNFLKGIVVQFDMTATNKIWVEAERYHFFDIVSSQSTMHKLSEMHLDNAFISYTDKRIIEILKELQIKYLKVRSDIFSTPLEKKIAYYNFLYSCPSGLLLTAGITTNYQELKTMYAQRKDHRLDEWHDFCYMIENLPYSELITGEE